MTLLPHLGTFSALKNAGLGKKVVWSFLGVITSNNTALSLALIIILGLLMGMYITVLAKYVTQFKLNGSSLKGIGGSFLGLLGIGCAACGSLILTPVLSVLGTTTILAILPLGGEEFLYLGILILCLSIRSLLRKMKSPQVCPVLPAQKITH